MTIAFRAAASHANLYSDPAHVDLTIPASVVVGDLMVASCFIFGGNTATTPAGWTLLRDDVATGGGFTSHQSVYWKVAASGDTGGAATVSFVLSAGSDAAGVLCAYAGANPTTPIQASAANVSSVGGMALTAPSATSTTAGALALDLFAAHNPASSAYAITGPATVRASVEGGGDRVAASVSDQTLGGAGPSGGQSATVPVTCGWLGQTVILAPATGGGGGAPAAALVVL